MKSEPRPFRDGSATVLAALRERSRQVPARLRQQARSRDFRVNVAVLLVLAALRLIDVRGLASVLFGLGALIALTVEHHRRQRARAADQVERLGPAPATAAAAQARRTQEES
jgi:hypothetical protein